MIAAWMLYGLLVAALVGLAGLALEHSLRALRRPIRFVWVGAMLVAMLLPAIQLVLASATVPARIGTPPPTAIAEPNGSQRDTPRSMTEPPFQTRSFGVPGRLSALDVPLLVVWLGLSMFWAAVLVMSARRLHRQSAAWKAAMLDGTPVYVSHDVGPALFGISRYRIVVPGWVLSLDGRQRQLLLAHEREHARASDPVMLAAGALLVVLQPWNPAVWLILRRLRFALELDCDARVLAQIPDTRAYGELLVEVGSRTLAGAAPVAAFSEPHSLLRRRITMITSRPVPHPAIRGAIALTAGALFTLSACYVPRPATVTTEPSMAVSRTIDSNPSAGETKRVIVRVTSVGLKEVSGPPQILVFTSGVARVGIGTDAPALLTDTLRLSTLPAFTADVTDGDLHLLLQTGGRMDIRGSVEGGSMMTFQAEGRHLVLLSGGRGVMPFGIDHR